MADFRERFGEYRPTKMLWFWSSAGVAVLTMIIGFTWGGWVTGGTARSMADDGAENAVAELAAGICVDRFMAAPDARTNLAALKEESSYSQDSFVEDGGWTMIGGREDPIDNAAGLCAEQLAEMEAPAETEAPVAEAETPATKEGETPDTATAEEADQG